MIEIKNKKKDKNSYSYIDPSMMNHLVEYRHLMRIIIMTK